MSSNPKITGSAAVNPWSTHGLTSLVMFAAFLDSSLLVIAFPSIRLSFASVSTAELSWILNAYTIVFGALLVPSGRLADQFGRKKMFLRGVGIFTLASALCGVAPNAGALIAARALQAVGAAMVMPTSLALLLAAFPVEMRAIAVTLWGAVGGLAAALGPSAGALLIQSLGWRSAFYINLPIGLLAYVLGTRLLRESRDITARVLPDFLGVVLLIAAVGLVTLGIVASEAWDWLDPHTVGFVVAGVILSIIFVRRSLRMASPALDLTLFSDANYRFANLATFLFGIAFFAMFLGNVLFLTQIWHYSTFKAGLAILPAPLTVIPVAVVSGRVVSRYGHRVLVIPGGILFGLAGISLLLRAGSTPTYFSVWLPSSLLVGLGVGLCLPVLSSAAVHGLAPSRFAVGSAVNQSVRALGAALGVALAVALLGRDPRTAQLPNFQHVFALFVLCGFLTSAASIGIRRDREAKARVVPQAQTVN
jgi:EmrB/QacA subfamily drug resistance transporter